MAEQSMVPDRHYISCSEAAKRLHVSIPRMNQLLAAGRVHGACQVGFGRGVWMIPVNANTGVPMIEPAGQGRRQGSRRLPDAAFERGPYLSEAEAIRQGGGQ